jgi:signal transduction histidine kinase
MSLWETLVAAALDAGAVALLGWTGWKAFQARERPSAPPFAALLALLTLWAVFAVGSELPVGSGDGLVALVLDLGQIGPVLLVPGVWVVYALGYTGRGTGLTRRRVAMFAGIALPLVCSGVVLAAGLSTGAVEATVPVIASLLGTELLYLFALFLYGTYLVVGHSRQHTRVRNLQTVVVVAGVAAPYLVGLVGSGGAVADGVTLGLLVSGGLFVVAIRRYPVLTGFPKADHVARTRVVEALQEAVIVVDWDDRIMDANETAGALFDRAPDAMVGEPVRSVVDGLDGSDLSARTTSMVTLRTVEGRRQFQYSVSPVDSGETDDGDESDPVARAVVFRDVTDRRTREQRLTVLNRVLRHNVRNELDVVLAHADRIDDQRLRAGITDSATDLVELSDKARRAEDIMTASTGSPESVDIAAVVSDVVEQYRDDDRAGEIRLSCPDELTVFSHRTVIREVVSELVDNALTHTDESSPRVDVTVRGGDDTVAEIRVADTGPGIPERDRQILAEETETALEHGQGIGLWFVNWGVTQLSGDLTFGENDPEGTVVTIRLYGTDCGS